MILPIVLAACAIGSVSAQCGTLAVPENRALPGGPQVTLGIAVVPATDRSTRRADPVFWIAGGPGGSALEDLKWLVPSFPDVLRHRDLVFVDQRGVGRSSPLSCQIATSSADPAELVRACLGVVGADVTHYRTVDAMDDLDAVRQGLGYDKIDVFGGSYGATAAQVYMRRHAETVRAVVLDGATLLDVPVLERWSSSGQRALDLLHRRCHADRACAKAFPRWYERFPALLAKLRRAPVRVGGATFDAAEVAEGVHELTATMQGAAAVPFLLARAEAGTYAPLARALALVPTTPGRVMPLAIMCTEPWAIQRPAAVRADARGTYLSYVDPLTADGMARACGAWPAVDTTAEDWSRVRSDVPTLVLVGGSDPKDPPRNVAGVTQAMPNAAVVTVPGGAHGVSFVGCLPRVLDDFLEAGTGRGLDTSCVSLTPYPAFRLR